jgi:hypothetical protein
MLLRHAACGHHPGDRHAPGRLDPLAAGAVSSGGPGGTAGQVNVSALLGDAGGATCRPGGSDDGSKDLPDRLSPPAASSPPSKEAAPVHAALVRATPIPAASAKAAAGEHAEERQQDDRADEGDDDLGDQ